MTETNWAVYLKCGTCFMPAGASCQNHDMQRLDRPHPGRKQQKAVNWSILGYCPTCERTEGAPCRDMRYPLATGQFNMSKPHKDRGPAQ